MPGGFLNVLVEARVVAKEKPAAADTKVNMPDRVVKSIEDLKVARVP